MPYQSRRQQNRNNQADKDMIAGGNSNAMDSASQKKLAREDASKNMLKTAAKGAGAYFGGPLGARAVDSLANTKAGQKALNRGAKALNRMPGVGRKAEKLNESGAVDAVDKGIDAVSGKKNLGNVFKSVNKGAVGGERGSSLPSSHSTSDSSKPKIAGLPTGSKAPSILENDDNMKNNENGKKTSVSGKFFSSMLVRVIVFTFLPLFLILLLLFILIAGVSGMFSEYEDAFGISHTIGDETGGLFFEAASQEQQDFYDRINNVKLIYQASGRTLDPLKVVAVYHVLTTNGADLEYKDMNEIVIMTIADAMFVGNSYDEDAFRNNLLTQIIPEYLPNSLDGEREQMVDDVFNYIERYYNLIGKDTSSSCASMGSCVYDIKGFYIGGRGDVAKNIQIKDLKVRLMECGGRYGNGSDYKPIDQPLVNFEDYIAGVAYAEIGSTDNIEALKAQMVVARSFALARPTAMGNALGKKLEQENGEWVLQIASCVSDQVFCNIDEGCSYMGGGDGQGGYVRSGNNIPGAVRTNDPLPPDHVIRRAAAETQGELLVNSRGYIISTGFKSSTQNVYISLANQGLNYKQILLQVYNQGNLNSGASDIEKASCNSGGSSSGCSTSLGDFANWKQYEGPWVDVTLGNSGRTIKQIGCLATSVSMQIAKSGVSTNVSNFNPGTFVEFLSNNGGFISGGNFVWGAATQVAPSFKYQGQVSVAGMSRKEKLAKIKELANQSGVYVVAEVKGNTGQHWVAIDSVNGDTINMMDPGSRSTNMWEEYNWANTSTLAYYKVS